MNQSAWQRRLTVAFATAVMTLSMTAVAQTAGDPGSDNGKGPRRASSLYIVEMVDAPVLGYTGGVPGINRTKPNRGQKIDPLNNDVVKYTKHLKAKHDTALQRVGNARKTYSYSYAFNGFAAELTEAQVAALRATPGVIAVNKDELRQLDTSSTPTFLGLNASGGLWDMLGGVGRAGENIVIGIVDSGITPESLSFSDRTGTNGNASKTGKLSYHHMPGWHGECEKGEAFKNSDCNHKLIGARYYNAGWGGNAAINALFPFEFVSPRDWGGHGTHTASTAGGNHGVPTTGPTAPFGTVSGMAPRARISSYKVCWADEPTGGGCFGSDSVAAIDQAVVDGVDVINFSISGSRTNFRDAVEIAFLFAADAGVFVAASAGNSGPASSTVAHPGPWLTTVAAGTHNRDGTGSTTLGNGVTYTGASFATAVTSKPLVDSANAVATGATAANAELCGPGALDSAKVAGKIVLCKRGVYALIDKSQSVADAGGVGMLLYNDPAGGTNLLALVHAVPTVHVVAASGLAIKAYIASTATPTASIAQSTIVFGAAAPFTASFSSRGPLQASADLLKPDLIAPGQDILAAVAPSGNGGREFDLYSGTSMSSPHVAGLAALLKDLHPDWSPMMIKSALMTTGTDVLDGPNTHPLVIFRQGAGHVRPNSAADPGLVYNAGFADWLGFLCGTQLPTSFCTDAGVPVLDPSNLNVASIAIGDMAGAQTVSRTVTNVGAAETYTFSYSGLLGITVTPNVAAFTINPGASQTFNVTFTAAGAALNAYVGGYITWTGDKGHVVRIPVVIRPVALAAPVQVSGSGDPINYNVTFGYTGPFAATPRGLVTPAITADVVADDPTDGACSLTTPNANLKTIVVPAGTTYARFSTFDADVNPGSDIDLCVFNSGGTLVGASGTATSAEEVNLVNPAAGTYTVVVHGWGVVGSTPFKLHTWLLDSTAVGNMAVSAPASATVGATATIQLTFSGLTAATRYLGSVAYSGTAGLPNPTIVQVNTP